MVDFKMICSVMALLQMDMFHEWFVVVVYQLRSHFFSQVHWWPISEMVIVCSWFSLGFTDKTRWKGWSSCEILFAVGLPLSVITLSFNLALCCFYILSFFWIGSFFWLCNGFTASNDNEFSGYVFIFSSLSTLRMEKWPFPKSAKIRWQPSFCDKNTVPCLTERYTSLVWWSLVTVAKWNCGGNRLGSISFSWSSPW